MSRHDDHIDCCCDEVVNLKTRNAIHITEDQTRSPWTPAFAGVTKKTESVVG